MQSARIVPLRTRRYDFDLHADVRRVVAYRAECRCGWKSRSCWSVATARVELHEHRGEGCG